MHLALASATGTGKSYTAQAVVEDNLDDYEAFVGLDYKGEFRGLVKHGLARHWIAGTKERDEFTIAHWRALLEQNPRLIIERHDLLSDEDWRTVVNRVIAAERRLDRSALFVFEEAHTVAPQQGELLENIRWMAQTGRGAKKSAIWVTQKLSEIDKVVISMATAWMIGGFQEENDLKKLRGSLDYNVDVHKLGGQQVQGLREDLHALDDGAVSVRVFREKDANGEAKTVGSEWVYSDDEGTVERLNTREWEPEAPHYGAEGKKIKVPGVDD